MNATGTDNELLVYVGNILFDELTFLAVHLSQIT